MTGAAKMALLANARGRGGEARGAYGEMRGESNEMRGGNYGGMRNESTNMEAMGYYPPLWQDPESRRRRDRRGRFTSEMDGGSARYEMEGGNSRMESEERRPMQIGFRMEEDMSRYRSDAGYPRMNESEHRRSQMDKGHAEGKGMMKLDKKLAEEWVNKLKGAGKGQKWSMEQVKKIMEQLGLEVDPLEAYVTMNMLYSDFADVARKYGLRPEDFFADLAEAWLQDEDAEAEDKLMAYYECVVLGK